MLVLVIESSTSSAKALLYDSEAGVVGSSQRVYGEAVLRTGMTDTEKVFLLSMNVAEEIARGREVAAIALCGTWHGLAVCNEDLIPVSPTISWDFTGTSDICSQIRKNESATDWMYRTTGCMPHNTYPRYALTWLRAQGMDLHGKKIVTQGGYNFFRLTGEYLESCCSQSGNGLVNLNALDYDEGILYYLGINRGQLGGLASYKDARPLSEEGANALGLHAGIPVVPAHADGALNQVGNFANRGDRMTMSIGTSGAIRVSTTKPVLPKGRELWCYYGVDKWVSGAAIAGACNCVDWFRNMQKSGTTFEELEREQSPESDTPVFLPFIVGERCPGWNDGRRGGFVGLDASCTQADLYKGLQMGILFNLYQCYSVLCAENGRPEQVIVSGGISHSRR